jgi:hypothetical protein
MCDEMSLVGCILVVVTFHDRLTLEYDLHHITARYRQIHNTFYRSLAMIGSMCAPRT